MNLLRSSHLNLGMCLAAALCCALPSRAFAANAALEEAKALLASGDHDQVEAGLQGLGVLGTADAVAPIVERVRKGLPPDLLDTAILTLMALGQPEAAPVLYELMSHRRPDVRVHAIEAVAALAPKGAETALSAALSDADAKVRSAAALALGEVKAAGSVERLFQALDRGNLEASTAIGKVLKPDQVARLITYLGKIPFRSLTPAIGELLGRKDITERDKIMVVGKLQEVGTPDVKAYLGDFLRLQSANISPALSKAILRAIQEIAN